MKTQHTHGPWQVKRGNGIYAGNSYLSLVLTENQHDGDLPYEANARLMAAAPELLEMVKRLSASLTRTNDEDQRLFLDAKKLIAKIEGDE